MSDPYESDRDMCDRLQDRVNVLTARCAKLVEAWGKYGDHLGSCRTNHPEHHPICDCGYDEICAALAAVKEE